MKLIDAIGLKQALAVSVILEDKKTIGQIIDEQPTIEPEQRWIPCSERLPEEGEVVLTQAKFKDDVKMAVSSRIDYNYWTTWGDKGHQYRCMDAFTRSISGRR